jgi:hypothetical protein
MRGLSTKVTHLLRFEGGPSSSEKLLPRERGGGETEADGERGILTVWNSG